MTKRRIRTASKTFTWIVLLLNPIAWAVQWLARRDLVSQVLSSPVAEGSSLNQVVSAMAQMQLDLPLTTLATATVTVVTTYVAGAKGATISKNAGKSAGTGEDETQAEHTESTTQG